MDISRLVSGTIAGFVATAPMSVVMKGIQMTLPKHEGFALPPSVITFQATKKAGLLPKSEEHHTFLTLLAHFGAGAGYGLFYGVGAPGSKQKQGNPIRGIVFGLLVWSINYMGIMPALNLYNSAEHEPARRNAMMIIAHLAYGLAADQVYIRLYPLLKKQLS